MIVNPYKRTTPLLCASILCALTVTNAHAENVVAPVLNLMSPEECKTFASNAERLACYDNFFTPKSVHMPVSTVDGNAVSTTGSNQQNNPENTTEESAPVLVQTVQVAKEKPSLLDKRWELTADTQKGLWKFSPYKPMYALPLFWTTKKNEEPNSPNPRNDVTASDRENLNSMESKFQISMKTKALENIFGDNGDLWLGYTQVSHWQVYNSEESRPFHANNYEPEAMLMFRTNYNVFGLNGRLLGVGFNHQSNGSSDPFSRSWNRVIFNLGFERDNFVLMIRPWIRVPEKNSDDDNPDIIDYMGRGDITAYYNWKDQQFSLMLRHNLKTGSDAHGAAQFDWTFPIKGNLRGHVQLFNGYGESLIDYNQKATYIGFGISLVNWY